MPINAAPDEIPAKIPSSFDKILAPSYASLLDTYVISSTYSFLRLFGVKLAPIPWILCGESKGATPTVKIFGLYSLNLLEHPDKVPAVPYPAINASILPSKSLKISLDVPS